MCSPCMAGMYCDEPGLTTPKGNCSEGYYCVEGSIYPYGAGNNSFCPVGNYCPGGVGAPLPCEDGTFVSYLKLIFNF